MSLWWYEFTVTDVVAVNVNVCRLCRRGSRNSRGYCGILVEKRDSNLSPHTNTARERKKKRKLEHIVTSHLQLHPVKYLIVACKSELIAIIAIIVIGAATTVSTMTEVIHRRL